MLDGQDSPLCVNVMKGIAHIFMAVLGICCGCDDIGTTEIYAHLDDESLREEILRHHPRNIKYRSQDLWFSRVAVWRRDASRRHHRI